MNNPFVPFNELLEFLTSHDGLLHRRQKGGNETDSDLVCVISSYIFTVGDLKKLVEAGKRQYEGT
jgi:hypothetical protein